MSMKNPLAKAGFVTLAFWGSHLVLVCSSPSSQSLTAPGLTCFFLLFLLYNITNFHGLSHCDSDRLSHMSLQWVSVSPHGRWIPPCLLPEPPFFHPGLTKAFLSTGPLNSSSRKPLLEVLEYQNHLQFAAILGQGCLRRNSPSLCQCDQEQARPPAEMKQICWHSQQLMDFFSKWAKPVFYSRHLIGI